MTCIRNSVAPTGAALAASLVALLAAACSSGTVATSTPASPAAHAATTAPAASTTTTAPGRAAGRATSCTVISAAQASAALGGQPVKPPVMGKAFVEGGRACVFNGPNVPPGASPDIPYADTVRVVLVTGRKAKIYFSDYRGKVHAQPISGLGDAAFYDGFASISVLKGHAYVRIAVGIANNLSAEKALAADALATM